jgi:hypothetical protein
MRVCLGVRWTSTVTELEEALMSIVGGLDVHRKQLTFDYVELETGRLERGQIAPADREHLAIWLRRFDGRSSVDFALEAGTGWRYVVARRPGQCWRWCLRRRCWR